MNTVDLIYQEARHLPEAEAREVLDFVAFLRAKQALPPSGQQATEADAVQRKAALLECFSWFQIDMSAFKFDREDANARR
jgi:hypothetical protein